MVRPEFDPFDRSPAMKQLHTGTEDQRRAKIIDVSRAADARYRKQLIARLHAEESIDNKRHIVRALSAIGGPGVSDVLLARLRSESGLILGDIATALGRLSCHEAIADIEPLCEHPFEWVRQSANAALRSLGHA